MNVFPETAREKTFYTPFVNLRASARAAPGKEGARAARAGLTPAAARRRLSH
jgi:hypothetical protein